MQGQGHPFGGGIIPLAISLSGPQGKQKHQVTITQVKNGFIVDVQVIVNEQPPLTQEEAQRKIGQFIRETQNRVQSGGDPVLDKAINQAKDEEKEQAQDILGSRVFYTLKELLAFLSFVYEEEEKEEKKGKKK